MDCAVLLFAGTNHDSDEAGLESYCVKFRSPSLIISILLLQRFRPLSSGLFEPRWQSFLFSRWLPSLHPGTAADWDRVNQSFVLH